MDIQYAKELLRILSDGVNPVTGEILPEADSCNQVEIVRALHTVLRFIEEQSRRRNRRLPENAGKPWTKEEEGKLPLNKKTSFLKC